jgi:hypothetical protein
VINFVLNIGKDPIQLMSTESIEKEKYFLGANSAIPCSEDDRKESSGQTLWS